MISFSYLREHESAGRKFLHLQITYLYSHLYVGFSLPEVKVNSSTYAMTRIYFRKVVPPSDVFFNPPSTRVYIKSLKQKCSLSHSSLHLYLKYRLQQSTCSPSFNEISLAKVYNYLLIYQFTLLITSFIAPDTTAHLRFIYSLGSVTSLFCLFSYIKGNSFSSLHNSFIYFLYIDVFLGCTHDPFLILIYTFSWSIYMCQAFHY